MSTDSRTLGIPGFMAEASCYGPSRHYLPRHHPGGPGRDEVHPALLDTGSGRRCTIDCRAQGFTNTQCAALCRDPCNASGPCQPGTTCYPDSVGPGCQVCITDDCSGTRTFMRACDDPFPPVGGPTR